LGSTATTRQRGLTADDRAAGADSADDRVRQDAGGQLAQHLRAEPAAVLLDVPLVVELLRGEVARLGTELASLGQRVGDLKVAERHHLRAERCGDGGPLRAHPVGHDHQHAVALDRRDHRHRVAGVPAGGFHDGVAGL